MTKGKTRFEVENLEELVSDQVWKDYHLLSHFIVQHAPQAYFDDLLCNGIDSVQSASRFFKNGQLTFSEMVYFLSSESEKIEGGIKNAKSAHLELNPEQTAAFAGLERFSGNLAAVVGLLKEDDRYNSKDPSELKERAEEANRIRILHSRKRY